MGPSGSNGRLPNWNSYRCCSRRSYAWKMASMQLFECLVAADFDHAADFLVGELLADRPAQQEDRDDVQVRRRRRRGRCDAARLACPDAPELFACLRPFHGGISSSGTRIWSDTGLARLAQDQPFLLQHLHHLIHRRRRDAHGRRDLGFGGRISVQSGIGVNERQISALSRSEVSHDVPSVSLESRIGYTDDSDSPRDEAIGKAEGSTMPGRSPRGFVHVREGSKHSVSPDSRTMHDLTITPQGHLLVRETPLETPDRKLSKAMLEAYARESGPRDALLRERGDGSGAAAVVRVRTLDRPALSHEPLQGRDGRTRRTDPRTPASRRPISNGRYGRPLR